MHHFVTGGTGFLGGHLIERLLARGDRVTALVRDRQRAEGMAARGVTLAPGDLLDKDSLRAGMAGADALFHVAGWYKVGVRDPGTAHAVNVTGTRNILDVMEELSIPKGVYTSTLAMNSDTGGRVVDESYRFEGTHLSEYDRTKALAHHQVAEPRMAAGLPLVIVQPGLIYGPGDRSPSGRVILDFLRGDLPALPKASGVCWGHVEDIAEGHLLALERGRVGESYIIAGPCHTFVEAFEMMAEISGLPAPPIRIPPLVMKMLAGPMGLLDRLLPLPPRFTGEGMRVQAGVTYYGSNGKARRELGYEPRPLAEGLRQSLPSYRAAIEGDA